MDRMIVKMHDLSIGRDESNRLFEAWDNILDCGHYLRGAYVEQFEQHWAAACGSRECVAVASGFDALALTLRALKARGRRVLLPALTAYPVWRAVLEEGGIPVGVDCGPDGNIDLNRFEDWLMVMVSNGCQPIALMVWLYGDVSQRDDALALCHRADVPVIEDCSHAHGIAGAEFPMVFSFYPTKNLAALGDAGAVVTDDPWLASAVRILSDHTQEHGRTSRMDELQAAVILSRMDDLPAETTARRERAARYHAALTGNGLHPPNAAPDDSFWHQYVIQVTRRDAFRARLAEHGIETGIHYHPLPPDLFHLPHDCVLARHISERVVSLPIARHVTPEMQTRVIEEIKEVRAWM